MVGRLVVVSTPAKGRVQEFLWFIHGGSHTDTWQSIFRIQELVAAAEHGSPSLVIGNLLLGFKIQIRTQARWICWAVQVIIELGSRPLPGIVLLLANFVGAGPPGMIDMLLTENVGDTCAVGATRSSSREDVPCKRREPRPARDTSWKKGKAERRFSVFSKKKKLLI